MTSTEKIVDLARRKGLTQQQLERLAGLSANRISKWKKGEGEPTATQALRLARLLGTSVEWLIDDAADSPPLPELSEGERMVVETLRDLGISPAKAVQALTLAAQPARVAEAYEVDVDTGERIRPPGERRRGAG